MQCHKRYWNVLKFVYRKKKKNVYWFAWYYFVTWSSIARRNVYWKNSVKCMVMIWLYFELMNNLMRNEHIIRWKLLYAELWWFRNECLSFQYDIILTFPFTLPKLYTSDFESIQIDTEELQWQLRSRIMRLILKWNINWAMHNICRKLNQKILW